ncbi:hypothetical protein ACFS7Z_24290 [Pontibacter toksunensis]|uniref:Uncharacterized protein n=1 Tax=Pontibacter toksunensis TaxID=1332631 RepID=A0ABW6C152_9BACT
MEHIIAFNREVADLVKRFPEHQAIKVIEKYIVKCKPSSYYMALDYLGFQLGMEYQAIPIHDNERDEVEGYILAIKFRKGNPLHEVGEDGVWVKPLRHDPMPSYSKCHTVLAKEYVYTLMQVTDLEKYVLDDDMVV